MKYFKFFFAASFLMLFFFATGARNLSDPITFGYVNSEKIMEEYKEAVSAANELDGLYEKWDNQAQRMRRDIEKKQKQYRDRVLILSDESRFKRQQEIQKLVTRMQEFQQDKFGQDGEASQRENELMEPIRTKIQEAIRNLAESDGFNYIFEISAGSDLLFVSNDQPDLTDQLIEILNKNY